MITRRPLLSTLSVILLASGALAAEEGFDRTLQVVYFTPADREPLPAYVERLDRVMTEVQRFYAEGMAMHGFGPRTFPLERDASGRLVVHLVKGARDREFYTSEHGHDLREEAAQALAAEGIDADRETLLIVGNLVSVDGDHLSGDCPYYGGGDHRSGTAWVTDYAGLDTRNLRRKAPRVYDNGRPYSLGKYNSVYIGGVTHELGHALGLPHVRANSAEEPLGTTLMSSGNYTFGEDKRGEGKGTFLSRASALMLADHPLFRRSDEGRDADLTCALADLRCEPTAGGMRISGRVEAATPPVRVIAFSDPEGGSDYDARTWDAEVRAHGLFHVAIGDLLEGRYELRLMFLFPNGAQTVFRMPFDAAANGRADHRAVELAHLGARALEAQLAGDDAAREEYVSLLERRFDRIPDERRTFGQRALVEKARSLAEIAASEPVTEPGPAPADVDPSVTRAWLCDLAWESAEVGYGRPSRDRAPDEKPGWLESADRYHAHGLWAHSNSRYVFRLGGEWERFRTSYALQYGAGGSVVFIVLADGEERLRTPRLRTAKEGHAEIDVTGVETLELIVDDGDGSKYQDGSVWYSPEISR